LTSFAVVKRFDDAPDDSGSIGQEAAEIWTAQAHLQPIFHKPDRLLASRSGSMAKASIWLSKHMFSRIRCYCFPATTSGGSKSAPADSQGD
jgi:hypothetical protein